jgi:hypothetical protein
MSKILGEGDPDGRGPRRQPSRGAQGVKPRVAVLLCPPVILERNGGAVNPWEDTISFFRRRSLDISVLRIGKAPFLAILCLGTILGRERNALI